VLKVFRLSPKTLVEVRNISRKASTAKIMGIYSTDKPMALATRTRPASGTAAVPIEAKTAVINMTKVMTGKITWPK